MIQKHVHKLKRYKYKTGNSVYFCTLPDCHYKIDTALALGKRTRCNICDTEFIINEYTIRLARPHCTECSKQKVKGDNGKNYYIRRASAQVVADIAKTSTDNLKSRLGSIVIQAADEDI